MARNLARSADSRFRASTFGDIQGNRDSGTAKLVRQGSLAAGQALSNAQGTGDEFDRALIHVQLLMVEHPEVSSVPGMQLRGIRAC